MILKSMFAGLSALALSTAALSAHAGVELVQNGGFELTTLNTAHEFGASHDGQTLTDWTSASGNAFNVYFPVGTATGPVNADTRFGEYGQFLWTLPANPDPNGGAFVALDGDSNYNGPLTQTINGLTPGASYKLSFDWATAQYADRSGPTTEQIQASLGSQTFTTAVVDDASHGATPWVTQTFTFTATGASEVLSFLSIGTPAGQPPVALLDGVSLTAVPEPATWAMMILGLLGVGLVARLRRRTAVAA